MRETSSRAFSGEGGLPLTGERRFAALSGDGNLAFSGEGMREMSPAGSFEPAKSLFARPRCSSVSYAGLTGGDNASMERYSIAVDEHSIDETVGIIKAPNRFFVGEIA